jgi:hypothetical protein
VRGLAAGIVVMAACGRIGFDLSGDAGASIPGSTLTLDQVTPGESLADFPLLVVLDDTRADRTKFQSGASNVRFYDASGTLLAHEVEQPGQVGGAPFLAWVFVPTIAGLATTIRVTYATAPEPARAPTWPAPYAAVWHLDETGDARDSAGSFDAVATGTNPSAGIIGGAHHFVATHPDYLTVASTTSYAPSAFTFSGWLRPTIVPSGFFGMATRQVANTSDNDIYLGVVSTGAISTCETASGESDVLANDGLTPGNWIHVVSTVTGSAGLFDIYVDGARKMELVIPSTGLTSNARPIFLGADRSTAGNTPLVPDSDFLDGDLDEVRLETVERSAAWIQYDDKAERDQVITYGPID